MFTAIAVVALLAACGADDGSQTVSPSTTAIAGPESSADPAGQTTAGPPTTATTAPDGPATTSQETDVPSSSGDIAPPSRSVSFPLHVDDQQRLVDATGAPFLMVGDTAWSLIAGLSREDATVYLDDRAARGFNTILVNLVEHKFSPNPPFNAYDERPFPEDAPFTEPNERYFEQADWIVDQAAQRGMAIVLLPAYAGYQGNSDGWYTEMQAAGPDLLVEYGRWLGERYRDAGNIIWSAGGDFTPPRRDLVDAIQEGIRSTDPDALQTGHGDPETASTDEFPDADWMDVNAVYSQLDVYPLAIEQFRAGNLPFFLIESTYENEHDATTAQLREQAYAAMLAGGTGQIFGNNPIWHFDGPGIFDAPTSWEEALDSPGAQSMTVLADFFGSMEWWRLAPAADGFIGDDGDVDRPSMAAASDDGATAVIYVPSARTITIDPSALGGGRYRATWIDPSDGSAHGEDELGLLEGSEPVVVSATNDGGETDWLLLLERTA